MPMRQGASSPPEEVMVVRSVIAGGAELPLLRGLLHRYAFFASLIGGTVLVVTAPGIEPRLAGAIFVAAVTAMFGASALYHWIDWALERRRWLRRLDHVTIYLCIAGSYTAYALLVLTGAWKISILAVVWAGVVAAIAVKFAWLDVSRWIPVTIGVALGWVGLLTLPQALAEIGPAAVGLTLAGGLLYTAGGVTYALRRPNPFPRIFGFHEVFHALVIAAVACHYAVIALSVDL